MSPRLVIENVKRSGVSEWKDISDVCGYLDLLGFGLLYENVTHRLSRSLFQEFEELRILSLSLASFRPTFGKFQGLLQRRLSNTYKFARCIAVVLKVDSLYEDCLYPQTELRSISILHQLDNHNQCQDNPLPFTSFQESFTQRTSSP
jgi:hypothetical protein